MVLIRLSLMLYSFMAAHKAACHTLLNAFLKSTKTWGLIHETDIKGLIHETDLQG